MLRSQIVFPVIRNAIARTNRSAGEAFRVCHFSVQGDHIHVLAEASSSVALERGARGLAIRIAKSVNQSIFHRGAFFADRYHVVELRTPRAVRNAIVYVLGNFRKHGHARKGDVLDVFSSAPYFTGFSEFEGSAWARYPRLIPRSLAPPMGVPTREPRTWLLSKGWVQGGRISVHESPRAARATIPPA
jgi:hypothetical protein